MDLFSDNFIIMKSLKERVENPDKTSYQGASVNTDANKIEKRDELSDIPFRNIMDLKGEKLIKDFADEDNINKLKKQKNKYLLLSTKIEYYVSILKNSQNQLKKK